MVVVLAFTAVWLVTKNSNILMAYNNKGYFLLTLVVVVSCGSVPSVKFFPGSRVMEQPLCEMCRSRDREKEQWREPVVALKDSAQNWQM